MLGSDAPRNEQGASVWTYRKEKDLHASVDGLEQTVIDFEEELKKFHPSLEVEDAEDSIYSHDLSDMTDVMITMFKEAKGENE